MTDKTPKQTYSLEEYRELIDALPPMRLRTAFWRTQHAVRNVKLSAKRGWRRWRRGYSEEDTWSFDHFLSGVIAGGLQRLRDREIGHPARLSAEEWNEVLDEMIRGFQMAQNGPWDMTYEDRLLIDHALELFKTYYFDLWD